MVILQAIVDQLAESLDRNQLFPALRSPETLTLRRSVTLAPCSVNRLFYSVAHPALYGTASVRSLRIFRSLPKHGHLVRALKLQLCLESDGQLEFFDTGRAFRHLTGLQWLELDLSFRRKDTTTLVKNIRSALSTLPYLRFLRLREKFHEVVMGQAASKQKHQGQYAYMGTATINRPLRPCHGLTVMPEEFRGHVCQAGSEVGWLRSTLTAWTILGEAGRVLRHFREPQAGFRDLRSLHLSKKVSSPFIDQGSKLVLPGLAELWLDIEAVSRSSATSGVWLDLTQCPNLRSLAYGFRAHGLEGLDAAAALPSTLEHLYLLDTDPMAFRHIAKRAAKLQTLVIYMGPLVRTCDRWQQEWHALQPGIEHFMDTLADKTVSFWPRPFGTYIKQLSRGLPEEARVDEHEQQAAFMDRRLPNTHFAQVRCHIEAIES